MYLLLKIHLSKRQRLLVNNTWGELKIREAKRKKLAPYSRKLTSVTETMVFMLDKKKQTILKETSETSANNANIDRKKGKLEGKFWNNSSRNLSHWNKSNFHMRQSRFHYFTPTVQKQNQMWFSPHFTTDWSRTPTMKFQQDSWWCKTEQMKKVWVGVRRLELIAE